ncbi:MAG TPA: hypothetical protein VG826_02520 [Pirellulales bacterium]|nr:hypothetical protein [Pirellulales bacterium]
MTSRKPKLTPIQAKLFKLANKGRQHRPLTARELNDPLWDSRSPASWTTFVPESLYEVWDDLTLDAKLVAYLHAASVRDGPNRFDML